MPSGCTPQITREESQITEGEEVHMKLHGTTLNWNLDYSPRNLDHQLRKFLPYILCILNLIRLTVLSLIIISLCDTKHIANRCESHQVVMVVMVVMVVGVWILRTISCVLKLIGDNNLIL